MKIVKATVAFSAIGFFIVLFLVLATIGFSIDSDFPIVNDTKKYFKFNDTFLPSEINKNKSD